MQKCFIIIMLFFTHMYMIAQSNHSWEDYFYDINGIDEYDETTLEIAYEHLCELEESPLNINSATFDDFTQIPGLSMDQISDIIEYRDRYGEMITIEELSMVESIDYAMRLFLTNFFVAQPLAKAPWYKKENLRHLLENGHGSVLGNMAIPLYERKGDNEGYYGSKYKYSLKLTGHYADYIKYGIIGAQDAGEPLFSHGNKWGMDHYSFYLNVNEIGRLKKLMLGRYRINFGMGLVQNTNFSFGKQTMLSSVGRSSTIISGHTSRSDANYFQGIAGTMDIGASHSRNKLELTLFYSYRNVDATLNTDGSVSTILTSGYHRTKNEVAKKNNTSALASGCHLTWRKEGLYAGFSYVYDWFNRDLAPSYASEGYKYRKYNARGNSFWNASVDYGYNSAKFSFSGETATGTCGAIATLNALQLKANSDLSFMAVQRFYSYKYYAIYSNAFSDGGHVQNESGLYLGTQWRLPCRIVLDAYSDLSYSPWLKYLVSNSSYSWDNSISGTYSYGKWQVMGRYRMRFKQRNNTNKTALADRYEHRGRLMLSRTNDKLSLRTQLDLSNVDFQQKNSMGWMLSQTAKLQVCENTDCSVMAAYFNTSDYDTRIYIYERSMLHTFSMPSFYGKGIRLSAVCRCDMNNHFMIMGKVGYTKYYDRDTIGTDLRTIDASYQTDIDIQIRYKF